MGKTTDQGEVLRVSPKAKPKGKRAKAAAKTAASKKSATPKKAATNSKTTAGHRGDKSNSNKVKKSRKKKAEIIKQISMGVLEGNSPAHLVRPKGEEKEEEKIMVGSDADVLSRLFPSAPEYTELSAAELKHIYPVRNEARSTRVGKLGRLKTISRVSHFIADDDFLRKISSPFQYHQVAPRVLSKVLTYVADNCILSSTQSLTNYMVVLRDVLVDWEGMRLSDIPIVMENCKRQCKLLIQREDPRAAKPVDAGAVRALAPGRRSEALVWICSGLRHVHARALFPPDLKFASYKDLNGEPQEELVCTVIGDKNISKRNYSYNIRLCNSI